MPPDVGTAHQQRSPKALFPSVDAPRCWCSPILVLPNVDAPHRRCSLPSICSRWRWCPPRPAPPLLALPHVLSPPPFGAPQRPFPPEVAPPQFPRSPPGGAGTFWPGPPSPAPKRHRGEGAAPQPAPHLGGCGDVGLSPMGPPKPGVGLGRGLLGDPHGGGQGGMGAGGQEGRGRGLIRGGVFDRLLPPGLQWGGVSLSHPPPQASGSAHGGGGSWGGGGGAQLAPPPPPREVGVAPRGAICHPLAAAALICILMEP